MVDQARRVILQTTIGVISYRKDISGDSGIGTRVLAVFLVSRL